MDDGIAILARTIKKFTIAAQYGVAFDPVYSPTVQCTHDTRPQKNIHRKLVLLQTNKVPEQSRQKSRGNKGMGKKIGKTKKRVDRVDKQVDEVDRLLFELNLCLST